MDSISTHLSHNILELRRLRGMTQAQLAKLSGIPRTTLTHFESGSGNPSLNNLVKLSQALQVNIEELLSAPLSMVQHFKSDELPKRRRDGGLALIYNLLPKPLPGVELERVVLEKSSGFVGVPHKKGTFEYYISLTGEVEIVVLGEKYRAEAGDILIFPGDEKHSYKNIGKVKAIGISVILFQSAQS